MPPGTTRATLPRANAESAPRELAEAKAEGRQFATRREMPRTTSSTVVPPDRGRSVILQKLLLNQPRRERRSGV
jgi:hypothetical protein